MANDPYEQLRRDVAGIRRALQEKPGSVLQNEQRDLLAVIQVEALCSIATDLSAMERSLSDIAARE
ncbi:hypothetical protein [Agromyces cerinus]|uniref:Uncharacterized protein n=1 Tax=Agromyces cerinus subsp. cerinus TaxID=232089 RepID=A0A1N6IE79_9MICO|nr:hypothetical protein [Agromyces cerinus]SIO30330.1 hypothetical protein SAMN05443544_3939 [Agromyces cerinus subsp. cerinus]